MNRIHSKNPSWTQIARLSLDGMQVSDVPEEPESVHGEFFGCRHLAGHG